MAKQQETAIVPVTAEDYPMVYINSEELRETIKTNLNGETLNFKDLRRIKVPSGGAESWSIPAASGGKPIPTNDFDGVIIYTELGRVMWIKDLQSAGKGGAGGGNKNPDCSGKAVVTDNPDTSGIWYGSKSRGFIAQAAAELGMGDMGKAQIADDRPQACGDCPFNQWGTGRNGKGKKCQEKGIFFLAMEDSLLPVILIAPVMSLDNRKKYLMGLSMNLVKDPATGKKKSRQYHEVITNFSLEADSNGQNDYSRIVFSEKASLPAEHSAAFASYKASMLPLVKNLIGRAMAAPAYEEPAEAPNDFAEYDSKIEYVDADEPGPTDAD